MKTRILIILTFLGFSLGGCYTSFASREYEEENFGQIEESWSLDEMNEQPDSMIVFQDENGKLDTVYLYTGNYTEVNDNPVKEVTVINNYYDDDVDDGFILGGFFGFPTFYAPIPYYGWYNPYFYDPFYCNYYPPYYGPTFYVYGDMYVGSGYYYDYPYYPSDERYRSNQSHWTNLRNNDGGRKVSRKSRDSYRTLPVASRTNGSNVLSKGVSLDREMKRVLTSGRGTELASLNKGGIRTANLEVSKSDARRSGNVKKVSSRSSGTRKIVKREAIQQSKPKRTASKSKYTRYNTNRKRAYTEIQKKSSYSKRKNRSYRKSYYRSKQEVKSSGRRSTSSKSYNRQRTSRSSGKSYNPSSSRSSYKSNFSRNSSSSYSGSRSSSRSSYSSPSSRASSRSSYSRPSTSRSSAPRSSAPRSSGSSRSSRRR